MYKIIYKSINLTIILDIKMNWSKFLSNLKASPYNTFFKQFISILKFINDLDYILTFKSENSFL